MKNNASLARANKNIRRRKLCGKAVTVFLLVALSVVFLVPFAWMLLTSLKSMEEVYQRTIFPTKLHFDNYILAVTQIPFLRYAWNTIVITALCVVGTVISSAMVAYSMSKVRWNGKKYLFPIIVATMMIPYQVTLIPLYMIWNKLGLIGSIAPWWCPRFSAAHTTFFCFASSLRASRIPAGSRGDRRRRRGAHFCTDHAAFVQTCNGKCRYFHFHQHMVRFYGSYAVSEPSGKLHAFHWPAGFLQQHYVQWGILMAASAIFTIPMIVLFFFAQKYFIEGITVTGVKADAGKGAFMNRILYVPLDERACNYEFPALLAGMTEDVALVEPPVGWMGFKKKPADIDALWPGFSRMRGNAATPSFPWIRWFTAISSIPNASPPLEACMETLFRFTELKRKNPELSIHAFNLVARWRHMTATRRTRITGRHTEEKYGVMHA